MTTEAKSKPWGQALPDSVKSYLDGLTADPLGSAEAQKVREKWVKAGFRLDPAIKAQIARTYMGTVVGMTDEQVEGFVSGNTSSFGKMGTIEFNDDSERGTVFWEKIREDHPDFLDPFDFECLAAQDPKGAGAWLMLGDWQLSHANTPLIGRMITDAVAYK